MLELAVGVEELSLLHERVSRVEIRLRKRLETLAAAPRAVAAKPPAAPAPTLAATPTRAALTVGGSGEAEGGVVVLQAQVISFSAHSDQ